MTKTALSRSDVTNFIQRFRAEYGITCSHFGVGYWFAFILFRRFLKEGSSIVYSRSKNRFGVRISGLVYDIDGEITGITDWILWDKERDEVRDRVIHESIMY